MFACMKTYILTLLLLLAALPMAAAGGVADDLYKQLSRLDSRRLYKKGYQYIQQGDNDKALTCYTIVADRIDPRDSASVRLAVGAMGNIAYIYSVDEFGKSFVYLDKALKIAERYGVKDKLPFLYLNMANVMRADETVRTPDRMSASTLDCYRKAYDAALAVGDWGSLLDAFNNVVSIAIGCNQLHDVKWLISNFRGLNIPEGTKDLLFSRLHCDAAEALMNGDTGRALACFERMKDTEATEGDVRALLQVWSDVASTYYDMGDYVRCVAADTTAIGIARSHGQRDVAVSFYENLVKCYKKLGNDELYRKYYLIYLEQKDSMYYQNQLLDVEHLRFTSELEEVNGKMKTLAAEKRNQQLVAHGAVLVAALSVVILALIAYGYAKIRKKNRLLFDRYQAVIKEHEEKKLLMAQYERQLAELKAAGAQSLTTGEVGGTSKPEADEQERKYRYNHIDEDVKDEITARIMQVMENVDEICREDFSVQRLSELVGWKYNYVAQVLSERFNKSFSAMLSEYRIREACKRLGDRERYGNYTIEGIAQSVGYKSRTSFTLLFKKITGLSPSGYVKMTRQAAEYSS